MNKGLGEKQPILRNGWFDHKNICISQPMYTVDAQRKKNPKEDSKNLRREGYLAAKMAKLSCLKPQCFNC